MVLRLGYFYHSRIVFMLVDSGVKRSACFFCVFLFTFAWDAVCAACVVLCLTYLSFRFSLCEHASQPCSLSE
jgi:hypothetical protein